MAELVSVLGRPTEKKKTSSSVKPDWSKLPEDLLSVISKKSDNCFDAIHARSVCSPWRSSFPFPSRLIRSSYSLPTYPIENVGTWKVEMIPLFLFISLAATSEFFVGVIGRYDSVDNIDSQYPLHCLMVNSQILPLGHEYRIICRNPEGGRIDKRMVAFLLLSKEEFVVLHYCSGDLLVLKSAERKWVRLANVPDSECTALLTFRGRFYATFSNEDVFVTDPYSLKATRKMPTIPLLDVDNYLVQCGNDELFMVEKSDPDASELKFRVSKLDEKTDSWVVVSDLGDRVLLIGDLLNVCFLAKELPDGCGVSGNSILFTDEQRWLIGYKPLYFYKYDQNCWKLASENLVTIDHDTNPFLSFKVEC